MDYEGAVPCAAWELTTPTATDEDAGGVAAGNCSLYGATSHGYGNHQLRMSYNASTAAGVVFHGATKVMPHYPSPPPPPPFCETPTPTWPKFTGDGGAGDVGLRLDVCNISVVTSIKKDRCAFWHGVVDKYWEMEKWMPATKPPAGVAGAEGRSGSVGEVAATRDRVRALMAQHVHARVARAVP